MSQEQIIEAFDAMWGLHPSPVMLLSAGRKIVAVNEAGSQLGIPDGIKCFSLTGQNVVCKGCLADEALKNNQARRSAAWNEKLNMFADTYWVPIKDVPGYFIHFGNNITEWVKPELINPSA